MADAGGRKRKVEDFLELEAEEVGQGEEELEGSELDELIDASWPRESPGKKTRTVRTARTHHVSILQNFGNSS